MYGVVCHCKVCYLSSQTTKAFALSCCANSWKQRESFLCLNFIRPAFPWLFISLELSIMGKKRNYDALLRPLTLR